MNIKKYFDKLKDKVEHYDQRAQNPFLKRRIECNPFLGAFSQTYIWIEDDEDEEDGQQGAEQT